MQHTHTRTQLQKCNKSVVHAADPLNAAASLSLSSFFLPFGRHFIWYFLLHFQVRFSQQQRQQRSSSFYICIFLRFFISFFLFFALKVAAALCYLFFALLSLFSLPFDVQTFYDAFVISFSLFSLSFHSIFFSV